MTDSDNRDSIVDELAQLGVTIQEPETAKEESFAQALGSFAHFVLIEQAASTQALLQQHSASVGELSGGNGTYSIYRISIHQDQESTDVAELLIQQFSTRYPQTSLTVDKLQHYMLQMCNKRKQQSSNYPAIENRNYNRLGNLMFILSFGPVYGQVRHIDHMNPNLQVCLYMSHHCPSTIVYAVKDPPIQNFQDLCHHWDSMGNPVPPLVQLLLTTMADVPLRTKPYAKYFAHWGTINTQLSNFGRLYQVVSHALQLRECDPGTALIAGGANHVHAGPPAKIPRMFAFAIAIPEDEEEDAVSDFDIEHGGRHMGCGDNANDDDENDGEIQYSPALLHIDLCCILFGMLDFDQELSVTCIEDPSQVHVAKQFLLERLLPFLQEYPQETYSIHFGDNRQMVREWLEDLVVARQEGNSHRVEFLLETASTSDTIMFSPDVTSKVFRKQQQRQHRRNKRQEKKIQNQS